MMEHTDANKHVLKLSEEKQHEHLLDEIKEVSRLLACNRQWFELESNQDIIAKSKKPVRKTVISICVGLCALLAVNLSGYFTGVRLPLNPLSIGVSAVGGIPGVTTMLLLNLIFI